MGTKTLLTIEEFAALEDPESGHYELDEGEVVEVRMSTARHNRARDKATVSFDVFLDEHPLGIALAETNCRILPEVVRRPDLAFFRADQLAGVELDRAPLEAVPSLILEVVSPSDQSWELRRKVSQYFQGGCLEVWLVYLDTREVHVERQDSLRKVQGDGVLECPELLPGFRLPLARLFAF